MDAKTKNIIAWVLTGLLAAGLLLFGGGKLMGGMVEQFEVWGLPGWFSYVVGALEVLGAAGLFFSKYRTWAIYGIIGLMIGAFGTHMANSEFGGQSFMPFIFIALGLGVYYFRKEST